ncbi:MAG: xanthine dehydrogenase family protein molybdopterin-binding subunit [Proteobacteria bacterium]|nr:xanthine dehydrogenase family protein molybdopterin-binding subunit [Pseudomonadota bacterium]
MKRNDNVAGVPTTFAERSRDNSAGAPTSRREFMQGVGVTLTVGATGIIGACEMSPGDPGAAAPEVTGNDAVTPNAWVSIGADDTITIQFGATEMGQGSMTSVPLVLAEEMDADWDQVRIETVSRHDPAYGNPVAFGYYGFPIMYTAGSAALRGYFNAMRQAGAQARNFLLDAAAAQWGVPVEELMTEPSRVIHAASGRSLSYGQIAAVAEVPDSLPEVPENDYKPRSEYRYLGTDVPRIDIPAKVDGSAEFGIDVRVPGMVYAAVLRTPVEGEEPVDVDDSATRAVPGVTDVVTLPYGVAVVGETVEGTIWGKNALRVTWSENSRFREVDQARDLDEYEARARDLSFSTGNPLWQDTGDIDPAFESADRIIEAVYRSDPAYHAQMEPMNATASVSADGRSAEVWVSTQTQSLTAMAAADLLGTDVDRITVHAKYIGGGYGRRAEYRQKDVEDALNLSRELGRPVKVIWSREDDVRDGVFRPLAAQYLRAALDADGSITALQQRVATPSVLSYMNEPRWALSRNRDGISMNGAQVTRYAIPNIRAEHVMVDRCSRLAAWRGVATSYTRFANESFIDEIAHELGADPLEFRLDLTRDNPAGRSVLEEVARMAEWSRRREGASLGVALSDYGGASVAAGIAEVSVNQDTGAITVHRYWMAIDAGFIVSPRNTEAQMEGNIVYGISSALKERISVNAGSVDQSNFHDYPVMRMNEMPELNVRALPSDGPPSGVGELGLATTGPAIANAVFAATGVRLRELPLTPDRVLAELRADAA